MKIIKIGNAVLTGKPKIVAVVTKRVTGKEVLKVKDYGADIIELRVDLLKGFSLKKVKQLMELIKSTDIPVICTIRKDNWKEQYRDDPESRRLIYFTELIPIADAVDIEYEADEIREQVIKIAQGYRKTIIFSYHNFKEFPGTKKLKDIYNKFKNSNAHVIKIAVSTPSLADAFELLSFIRAVSEYDFVVGIGMGRAGEFTRIIAGMFGSCLTYGYIDKSVAPGQMRIKELAEWINKLY
jgi:3-dehydroquinate dehydratase-1